MRRLLVLLTLLALTAPMLSACGGTSKQITTDTNGNLVATVSAGESFIYGSKNGVAPEAKYKVTQEGEVVKLTGGLQGIIFRTYTESYTDGDHFIAEYNGAMMFLVEDLKNGQYKITSPGGTSILRYDN